MRLAVISDIHGNLEAFKEVLADIDQSDVDRIICLGDNIGYGPEPEEVVRLLRSRDIPSVMGNHEWGLIDERHLEWFNPFARTALLQTRELLSEDSLEYIRTLPASIIDRDCRFVHGCPPESITTYLFELTRDELGIILSHSDEYLTFVGHTHELVLVSCTDRTVQPLPFSKGPNSLEADDWYLVNIGSVGQPRDGSNQAKYVIWDDETRILHLRLVPYDIAKTANKIIELGFPRMFADRLW
jgi:predicted phosphodiesterase